ncbi:hypothetical protein AB0M02_39355 [Actinoplanes sp. NPDC051861]|uniref:hypothetical protein n=1 Tax=Actinoplanes sp. NPDC051861 TaxID=3155170 RepID=UPI0034234943
MISGDIVPYTGKPAPSSPKRPFVLFAVVVLALCSVGMIVIGMMDRPAEPSWATGSPLAGPASPLPSVSPSADVSPQPSLTRSPRRSPSPSASRRSTKAPAKPSVTSTTRKPAKPTTAPATAPTTPVATSAAPAVATLLGDCATEGARAQTSAGWPLVCLTRPWDPELRWRLG